MVYEWLRERLPLRERSSQIFMLKASSSKKITCCYFGILEKPFARDRAIISGLKENNVKIIKCIDSSRFFLKFLKLIKKHWVIRNDYDFMLVGYLSNVAVPLARFISGKKIIYNAGHSMYEGIVLDREEVSRFSLKALYIWTVDFLAFYFARLVLVESEEQKKFLEASFFVRPRKMRVIFTGADNNVFYPDQNIRKKKEFTVAFRGWFIPGTGIEYVLGAAKLLKGRGVNFLIIGRGMLKNEVKEIIARDKLNNTELVTEFLPDDELREKMLSCHMVLGQFADHPRMERTIQNKTFEALALRMPYITRDSASNREILKDRENCLFVSPADAADLAEKILELKNNIKLREKIAQNGYKLYKEKLTPKTLGKSLLGALCNFF